MIVENEEDMQHLYSMILEKLDCEIIRAYDGGEALQKLEETTPDLIILDILLNEVMGYTFFEKIRQEARYADVPVIITTVLNAAQCRDLVDIDPRTVYIEKPFQIEHLREAVAEGLKLTKGSLPDTGKETPIVVNTPYSLGGM